MESVHHCEFGWGLCAQVSNRDLQLDHCLLHDEEGTNKSCLPLLKLCDWGLGTSYRSDDGATESLLGTPGYCAPEVQMNQLIV